MVLLLKLSTGIFCKERNERIFKYKSHTVYGCIFRTYLDVSFLTDQLSDKERLCISEDNVNYLDDYNPGMDVQGQEDDHIDE